MGGDQARQIVALCEVARAYLPPRPGTLRPSWDHHGYMLNRSHVDMISANPVIGSDVVLGSKPCAFSELKQGCRVLLRDARTLAFFGKVDDRTLFGCELLRFAFITLLSLFFSILRLPKVLELRPDLTEELLGLGELCNIYASPDDTSRENEWAERR